MNTKKKQIQSTIIKGNLVTVDISTKKHPNTFMECDLEDYITWRDNDNYGRISAVQFVGNSYPYARFHVNMPGNYKHKLFHRHVLPEYKMIDHKDRDGLNNRKSNLRDGTGVNTWNVDKRKNNTSGFTGVTFDKDSNKWLSQIRIHTKTKHLGRFNTPDEASEAYQKAKLKYHKIAV